MQKLKSFVALFTILIISGCVSHPKRPDVPMCGPSGDCTDATGETHENPSTLICTTPSGYSKYEDYIDGLELRIRELERRCKISKEE